MRVEPVHAGDLAQLQALVNRHLGTVAPGWALSAAFLARHLARDETEVITDPWVAERLTLGAYHAGRLLAAAHLLRYADRPEVGDAFRGLGEIGWVVGEPAAAPALDAVLTTARDRFAAWRVRRESGWGAGLPAGPFGGVADTWPHIAEALMRAGYQPARDQRDREALYGGALAPVPAPLAAPITGLTLDRGVGRWGVRFVAVLDGTELAHADTATDLTHGGAYPAPGGWAELGELWVRDDWRDRGVGGWLVRHLAAWHRLAGAERIVLSVAADDEARGAGRFYQRFGWHPLVRSRRIWLPADRAPAEA